MTLKSCVLLGSHLPEHATNVAGIGTSTWQRTLGGLHLALGLCTGGPAWASGFSLELTDWLNRGASDRCAVSEDGSTVYVAMSRTNEDGDVSVFDITDVGERRLRWVGTVKGLGNGIQTFGGWLLTMRRDAGLCVWDMTAALTPVLRQTVPDVADSFWGYRQSPVFAVGQGRLFAVNGNRIWVFEPVPTGLGRLGGWESPLSITLDGSVDHVVVLGSRLFSTAQNQGRYVVAAIDVADPAHPKAIQRVEFTAPGPERFIGGSRLAGDPGGRQLVVTAPGDNQVHVFDIADPGTLRRLGSYLDPTVPPGSGSATDGFQGAEFLAPGRLALLSGSHLTLNEVDPDGTIRPRNVRQSVVRPRGLVRSGGYLFLHGWDVDLAIHDASASGTLASVAKADPNPDVSEIAADGSYAYVLSYSWETARSTLNAYAVDPTSGRLGAARPVMTFFSGGNWALGLGAQRGRIVLSDGRMAYLLERDADGNHRETFRGRIGGEAGGQTPEISVGDGYFRAGRTLFEVPAPGPVRALGSPDWARTATLFGRFALATTGGPHTVYRLPDLAEVGRIVDVPGDVQAVGDRLYYHSASGIRELRVDDSGAIQVTELTPKGGGYPGSWNLTVADGLVLSWYGSVCRIYDANRAAGQRLALLGESPMTQNLCHGGWYGVASGGLFYTADAFAGLSVFRIVPGFQRVQATHEGAGLRLSWPTLVGRRYALYRSDDLRTWRVERDDLVGTGSDLVLQIPALGRAGAYRVADVGAAE